MISTKRIVAGLQRLIDAEKQKLAAFGNSEIPREAKEAIRILIPAFQKLNREVEYAEKYGNDWLYQGNKSNRYRLIKAAYSSTTSTHDNFKEPVCDREEDN